MVSSNGYYDDSLSREDAVTYLRSHLEEFPFADWREDNEGVKQSRSQAVHVAAMMSQFGGKLLPRESLRPGFIYNSNTQRSGKSLLAAMAIIPCNGRIAPQAWSPKDEELRKVLDAEVLRASRYICFDNVRSHISSQVLEGFMTSPMWTGRLLGKTQMFEAANAATVFITGNDLSVSPDIKHRTLEVTLFVAEADVQTRVVKHPIDIAWLMNKKNRHDILNALWAIVRRWDDHGQPLASRNLRVGYESWCEVFGGLVQFAGFGDPLAPPEEFDEEHDMDTETHHMRLLVAILAEPILTEETCRCEHTFQEIVNVAHAEELFGWILDGKEVERFEAGILGTDYVLKPDAKSKFGKLMKRYAPYVGELQGPRFRLFRIGKGGQSKRIRMSSIGSRGRRKFIVEVAEKAAD
jgi:hypothetical protein